ncbi:cathepsin L1-like [Photinus pyralis]|uniref:cathepsin L1-like n=1 Tax=Photinus pyralis TaxID=7054 RepID=UPI0012672F9E|nr:cathepsin L1-like [Photinus pyralis]
MHLQTAAVESQTAIKTGKLQDISPQEVLDCSQVEPYENYGCDGGSLEPAYDYIKSKGVVSDQSYPYTATTGEKCNASPDQVSANIKSYVTIQEGDEEALKEALSNIGPIAVGMDASSENWQFYGGGIYYEPDCKSAIENLNHAVTLVGYGEENGMKYWIVKNSYGTSWGENGYAKIARNETNHCGIASYAVYPLF